MTVTEPIRPRWLTVVHRRYRLTDRQKDGETTYSNNTLNNGKHATKIIGLLYMEQTRTRKISIKT